MSLIMSLRMILLTVIMECWTDSNVDVIQVGYQVESTATIPSHSIGVIHPIDHPTQLH